MGKGRAPCCDKSQVKKGPWSPAEDLKLIAFIQKHGHENWRALPKQAGLMRCGKSCRLRWINYLRPDVKRGNFTAEEEETIIKLHKAMGNKWSKIASRLPGRTDNEIKNVWNTHLKKRLTAAKSSDSREDNANDGSKIESSVTSPSSSSSESFFSNETPKTNNNNPCNETNDHISQTDDDDQDSGGKLLQEVIGITEETKGSSNSSSSTSLSSCIEYKKHDEDQQQLVSPTFLNCVAPYDIDVTLEEVDKPNNNNLETKEDCDFWKMLDNIESFLSSNEASPPPPPPHQSQTSPTNLVHQDDDEATMMMMWSHEFENELGGVVGEATTKGSNNKAQQEIIMDPSNDVFDLDLVTRPPEPDQLESELDLGYIQLWPSLPPNTIL
ncbi:hypothetical protein HN51_026215 [Arachis hypogaea]|uniref:Uncharacterized protein n=1 Tax=Arachis hypogaea TaxID=3818 RepID=A0A445CH25_ARAHY|nr:transcription factor MYB58-like [Arachis hypogaea]QHO28766.1 Myb-related protein [Arachis hypogaea]RYR50221.1 hypothetical protein Ahy_A07g036825 [Arachis hypogaea]